MSRRKIDPRKLPSGASLRFVQGKPVIRIRLMCPDGKRRDFPHAYTVTEARDRIDAIKASFRSGNWRSPEQIAEEKAEAERQRKADSYSFGDYAKSWFEVRESSLSPTTLRSYRANYRNHLGPKWADVPLKQIRTAEVRQWLAAELAPGRDGARRRAYELFRAILNTAVEDEFLDFNPCKRNLLRSGKRSGSGSSRHAPRALSVAELKALADEVPEWQRVLILVMGLVGLRLGEARELRRKDVDLGAAQLHVRRAVSGDGKNKVLGTPKTEASIRTIPLADEVVELLRGHLAAMTLKSDDALLFPSSRDVRKHIGARTVQLNVERAARRLEIPHVSPHDLRHTAASLVSRESGNPAVTQKILGHTTATMALRYTHADSSQQLSALGAIASEVLGGEESSESEEEPQKS